MSGKHNFLDLEFSSFWLQCHFHVSGTLKNTGRPWSNYNKAFKNSEQETMSSNRIIITIQWDNVAFSELLCKLERQQKVSYSMYLLRYLENIGLHIRSRNVESDPRRKSANFLLISLHLLKETYWRFIRFSQIFIK